MTNDEKKLRVFGPSNEPEDADCLIATDTSDLSAVIETLQHYIPQMIDGEQIVFRVKAMTDAEVEAMPDV